MTEEDAAEALRVLDQRQEGCEPALRAFVEANRLAPSLGEGLAGDLVYEELCAVRRERRGVA